ncbi:unnamed protein product, partial [Phaeothamnion confervicola]
VRPPDGTDNGTGGGGGGDTSGPPRREQLKPQHSRQLSTQLAALGNSLRAVLPAAAALVEEASAPVRRQPSRLAVLPAAVVPATTTAASAVVEALSRPLSIDTSLPEDVQAALFFGPAGPATPLEEAAAAVAAASAVPAVVAAAVVAGKEGGTLAGATPASSGAAPALTSRRPRTTTLSKEQGIGNGG